MSSASRTSGYAVGVLILLAVAGVALYLALVSLPPFHRLSESYTYYLRIGLAAVFGYLAVVVVGRFLAAITQRFPERRHGATVLAAYRFVAYFLLAIFVLYVAGVNGYALLAGSTFAGLVLGLAGQVVLANLIAGIVLILVRPFQPGDRITIVTWQYGLLMPAYPPRFFSNDTLIPGYTGVVRDLGLVYTLVEFDDGTSARIPNGVVIQAMVVGHGLSERWVRVRYDVPPDTEPRALLELLRREVSANKWVVRPESVRVEIDQATQSGCLLRVDAVCRGNMEEPPRSDLYLTIIETVRRYRAASGASAPQVSPSPGTRGGGDHPTADVRGGGAQVSPGSGLGR
jgi:small conductance mechanosensitive channel